MHILRWPYKPSYNSNLLIHGCTTIRDKLDHEVVSNEGIQLCHDCEHLSHSLVLCSVYTFCIIVPNSTWILMCKMRIVLPKLSDPTVLKCVCICIHCFSNVLFIKKWTCQYHFINIFFSFLRFLPPHFSKTNESLVYTYTTMNNFDSIGLMWFYDNVIHDTNFNANKSLVHACTYDYLKNQILYINNKHQNHGMFLQMLK